MCKPPRGIFFLIAALLFIGVDVVRNPPDSDSLAQTLFTGKSIMRAHALPRVLGAGVFSVPDARWFTEGWLGSLAAYALYRLGGYPFLVLFDALAAATALILVDRRCRERGLDDAGRAVALGIVCLCSLHAVRVGAEVIDLFFTALLLLLLDRAPRKSAFWSIALTILWCNASLHGPIAAFWGALSAAGRSFGPTRTDRLRRAGFYCSLIAAMLLTPQGFHVFSNYIADLHLDPTKDLHVWQPALVDPMAFYGGLLPTLVLAACCGLRRAGVSDVLVALGAIFLSLQDGRYLGMSGVVLGPIVATAFCRLRDDGAAITKCAYADAAHDASKDPPACSEDNASDTTYSVRGSQRQKTKIPALVEIFMHDRTLVFSIALLIAGVASCNARASGFDVMQGGLPQKEIIDRLAADGKSHNLFCADDRWCAYALLLGSPRLRVFEDGREQAYPSDITEDTTSVVRVKAGWKEKINARGITDVMTSELRLVSLFELLPRWRCSAHPDGLWLCEKEG